MSNAMTIEAAPGLPTTAGIGASSTAEITFVNAAGTTALVKIAPSYVTNKRFRVRAGGRVTGGTTTNFTATLYFGTPTTSSVFTSGAKAVNSVSGNWDMFYDGHVDSTSKILQGQGSGVINNVLITSAAGSAISSVDPAVEISFAVTGTFSASNAGNVAFLDTLEVDLF